MKISFEKSHVEKIDHMGNDATIVNAARVSFNKAIDKMSIKDEKLLLYLAKNDHWSPFAHTSIQLRVSAPIFVARQLVKHTVGGVWNEVSRRYVSDNVSFYLPDEWRSKPVNAKQGSGDNIQNPQSSDMYERLFELCRHALFTYNDMIDSGVAPEQARMVLPQNLMTQWYWTGSLMFWYRVCKLRLDNHAQKEAQQIAEYISDICKKTFPISWMALFTYE